MVLITVRYTVITIITITIIITTRKMLKREDRGREWRLTIRKHNSLLIN